MSVFRVRVRQLHHAWFRVEAATPQDALAAAAKSTDPELVEYAEDFPAETWDVEDEQGETLIEGRPVDMTSTLPPRGLNQ